MQTDALSGHEIFKKKGNASQFTFNPPASHPSTSSLMQIISVGISLSTDRFTSQKERYTDRPY